MIVNIMSKGFSILLFVVLVLGLIVACTLEDGSKGEWFNEVNSRQREGLATDVPTVTPQPGS